MGDRKLQPSLSLRLAVRFELTRVSFADRSVNLVLSGRCGPEVLAQPGERRYAVPGPSERGHQTWPRDSWSTASGIVTTGSLPGCQARLWSLTPYFRPLSSIHG